MDKGTLYSPEEGVFLVELKERDWKEIANISQEDGGFSSPGTIG
jgi:hypothetical protein